MSNTASVGNPKQRPGCSPIAVLIVGALALAFAALLGPRLVGVLLALAAPPDPPVLGDTALVLESHENLAHGFDEWIYVSPHNVCEVVRYYHRQNGQCPLVPPQCEISTTENTPTGQDVAYCFGDVEFSIFAMRWRFRITGGDVLTGSTKFHLSRVISWTGSLPAEAP